MWLTDPRISVNIRIGSATHFFGCHCCTEQEMLDFIRMRVAELLRCGQFDTKLTEVDVSVACDGATWNLVFNEDEHNFEIKHDSQKTESL